MDQQNKTKPEANQNKPAELSDKDLEQVAGGAVNCPPTLGDSYYVKSPRDSASGQATGFKPSDDDTVTSGQ